MFVSENFQLPAVPGLGLVMGAIVVLYSCYLLGVIIYNLFFHPLARFPGPVLFAATPIPYVKWQVTGRLPFLYKQLHDAYGDVVRIHPNELSFNNPAAWKDIYALRPGRPIIPKDPEYTSPSSEGVYNVVTATNVADHTRYRRALNLAFSERALREQEPIIMKYVDMLMVRLRQNAGLGPQNIVAWFNFMSFDIVGDLSFADSLQGLEKSEYHPWLIDMFNAFKFALYTRAMKQFPHVYCWLQYLMPKSLVEQRRKHERFTHEKVNHRLSMVTERRDFMSHLLPFDEKTTPMSLPEIRNTYGTLMIAGSETTATTLSFTLFYLCKNQPVLAGLVDEVRSTFTREKDITFASTAKLRYQGAVLNESMRIKPAAPTSQPRLIPGKGEIIAGRWVPGGCRVAVPPLCMNHSPQFFWEPLSFRPERWLDDPQFASDNKAAFQPFSIGPRSCIGRTLALNELKVVLARLLWNFDISLAAKSRDWADKLKVYGLWEMKPFYIYLEPVKRG